MYEIRIHGRGGQGAVLAAKILAKALVEQGKHAKSIPSFGFERRGAPVTAFLRFDDRPIRKITNIYHPDCIICLDGTLPRSVDIFQGMTPNGVLVQATKKELERLDLPENLSRVGLCDAFGLALGIFGRPITNSIMLGSFARTTGLVSKQALRRGMESVAFRDANLDLNFDAIERGYEETTVHDLEGAAKA